MSSKDVVTPIKTKEEEDIEFDSYRRNFKFSWKKLWAFSGPGLLMSIAYLDPGNSK